MGFGSRLIIWDVWKERNNRIFKNKIGSPQSIMTQIIRQLKETVGTLLRSLSNNQPHYQDEQILLNLGLQGILPQGTNKKVGHIKADKEF